jgi:hypothetical protein
MYRNFYADEPGSGDTIERYVFRLDTDVIRTNQGVVVAGEVILDTFSEYKYDKDGDSVEIEYGRVLGEEVEIEVLQRIEKNLTELIDQNSQKDNSFGYYTGSEDAGYAPTNNINYYANRTHNLKEDIIYTIRQARFGLTRKNSEAGGNIFRVENSSMLDLYNYIKDINLLPDNLEYDKFLYAIGFRESQELAPFN